MQVTVLRHFDVTMELTNEMLEDPRVLDEAFESAISAVVVGNPGILLSAASYKNDQTFGPDGAQITFHLKEQK